MLIILFLLSFNASAVDISEYTQEGGMEFVPNYSQLSGITRFDDGVKSGDLIVANGGGKIRFNNRAPEADVYLAYGSMGGCSDVEGIRQKTPGIYYLLNEHGQIYEMTLADRSCSGIRTIETGINYDNNRGLEGIAVSGSVVYLVKERDLLTGYSPVYTFVDDGILTSVTPQLLFMSQCRDGADIDIRPNGNLLIPCQSVGQLQEYTQSGELIATLDISIFNNAEGVYEEGEYIYVVGEGNEYAKYTSGVVVEPREIESCTYSGSIDVYVDNGAIVAPQAIGLICPTATASGTIQ